jgi:GT2 family glycosyltransferase
MLISELVSVIIPNFNGKLYLEPCLRSVLDQDIASRRMEVIVIDNASTDGSPESARISFPGVHFICNEQNAGYTIAVNQGLEAAQGQWILLLNNDTVLQPGSLNRLITSLATGSPDLGGVQPLLVYAGDPSRIDSTGIALSRHLRARDNRHGESLSAAPVRAGEIWGCCAACVLVKREVYDKCGMLDPDFFAEWDDVDFAMRARWHQFTFALEPEAIVHHHRSPTSKRDPISKIVRHRRNQLLTVVKAVPAAMAFRLIAYRFFRDLFMIPHFLRKGEMGAATRVWMQFIRLTPAMLRRRRELMLTASVTPGQMSRELKRFMHIGES